MIRIKTPFANSSKTYQSGHQIYLETGYNPYVAEKFKKLFHILTRHYRSIERMTTGKRIPTSYLNQQQMCTTVAPLYFAHFHPSKDFTSIWRDRENSYAV